MIMRGKVRTILVVLLCVASASCAAVTSTTAVRFDATTPIKPPSGAGIPFLADTNLDHQVDLEALLTSELARYGPTPYPQTSDVDVLMAAVGASPQNVKIRNDVVATLLKASTGNCYAYVKSLRGDQVGSRLLFDALSGGFATAGSLLTHPEATRLLGGLSAFSTAEGSSIDRNIFAQQAAEAIGDAMLKLQAADRAQIEANMLKSYDAWPLGLALADVLSFHGDCSVTRGLVHMQNALQQRESAIQAVRAAAALATTDSASAPALLKMISALEDPMPSAVPAAPQSPGAWSADLQATQNTISGCMGQEAKDLEQGGSGAANAIVAKFTSCLPSGSADWLGLSETASGLVSNVSAWPTRAAGESSDAFNAAVENYFATEEAEFHAKTDSIVANKAAVRAVMATRLGAWSDGAPADVVTFLRSLALLSPAEAPAAQAKAPIFSPAVGVDAKGNVEFATLDPVLAYAIATAYPSESDGSTGTIAAEAALKRATDEYETLSTPAVPKT